MLLSPYYEVCTYTIPYSGDTSIEVISKYSLISQSQGKYNQNEPVLFDSNKKLFDTIDLNRLYFLNF